MTARIAPAGVRRILVVRLSSLGDLFHALPAVHGLKAATGATVDWLVQPAYLPLLRCFTDVDRVLTFPRRNFLWYAPRFLRELRRERYDLVADLQGLLKSAIPARLARRTRGARVIGPSYHREGARFLYHDVTGPRNKNRHAVEENLDLLRWLGWPEPEPVFPVRFPARPAPGVAPRVALVPASRWPTKNWGVEGFAELARRLLAKDVTVLLVGGRDEASACADLAAAVGPHPGLVNLAGRTTLVELGSLLQETQLVVTVDSGPMHMAAALGVPVLALFGPTDPTRTGPYGRRARVLWVDRLPCRPCFSTECSRGDFACMRQLYPSRVSDIALDKLREQGIAV